MASAATSSRSSSPSRCSRSPTYMLAGWRKHDREVNEAAIKYYLIGVFASAVMLYGMSLIFGVTGTTLLVGHRGRTSAARRHHAAASRSAIVFVVVGFAFKVCAVPFHTWAPDTYEGAPTPVTAFLSVASKAGGLRRPAQHRLSSASSRRPATTRGSRCSGCWPPLSMTVGNLVALRQTNIVRMLAYSSIAQGGFMLVPFAVAGIRRRRQPEAPRDRGGRHLPPHLRGDEPRRVRRGDRRGPADPQSAEISATAGCSSTRPGSRSLMTIFLFSLAGIPPLAGWFAKFVMFRAVLDAGTAWGDRARRDRGGQLGDRVLLLRRRRPGDVVPRARADDDRTPHPMPRPPRSTSPSRSAPSVVVVVGVYPQLFARRRRARLLTRPGRRRRDASPQRIHRGARSRSTSSSSSRSTTEDGFFAAGSGAGRAGRDFLTSPEVGPLFGACWPGPRRGVGRLGEPDPFVVVEAGAGHGRARPRRAARRARVRAALRYVLVERSAALRARAARQPAARAAPTTPSARRRAARTRTTAVPVAGAGRCRRARRAARARGVDGVVIANELLDNLPFGSSSGHGARWARCASASDAATASSRCSCRPTADAAADASPTARRAGGHAAAAATRRRRGCAAADASLRRGACRRRLRRRRRASCARAGGVAAHLPRPRRGGRPARRARRRRTSPPTSASSSSTRPPPRPVASDAPRPSGSRAHGVDELVDEAAPGLAGGAPVGDLEALRTAAGSSEADALTDPAGLGAYRVLGGTAEGPRAARIANVGPMGDDASQDARHLRPRGPDLPAVRRLLETGSLADRSSTSRRPPTRRASGRPRRASSTGTRTRTILEWELPFASGSSAAPSTSRRTASTATSPPARRPGGVPLGRRARRHPHGHLRRAARREVPRRQRLEKLGVGKGDRVGIYMGMVPETIAACSRARASAPSQRWCSAASRRIRSATASTTPKPRCSSPPTARGGAARSSR